MEEHVSLKTENLRKYLKKKGYSLEQVASKLNMSRQNLNQLMKKEYFKTDLSKTLISIYGKELEEEKSNKNVNTTESIFTIDKVLEVMEENRNLWKFIASKGIKVPANFNFGELMPTYGSLFLGTNNP